ncbi:MAG: hypothetical protein ACLROW_07275 [Roseburia faecis]
MHKLLEGMEDDLDDNLEDDLDDPEEDTDDREKEREDHYRDADDEDIMLQKELAEEVRSSMLGRKKKTTKKIPMTISNLLICRIVTGGINFDSIYR